MQALAGPYVAGIAPLVAASVRDGTQVVLQGLEPAIGVSNIC